jgi:hypothetical protein
LTQEENMEWSPFANLHELDSEPWAHVLKRFYVFVFQISRFIFEQISLDLLLSYHTSGAPKTSEQPLHHFFVQGALICSHLNAITVDIIALNCFCIPVIFCSFLYMGFI